MLNTARWVAGISGSIVAGAVMAYLGMGALFRAYPVEPVELEGSDGSQKDQDFSSESDEKAVLALATLSSRPAPPRGWQELTTHRAWGADTPGDRLGVEAGGEL